MSFFFNRKSLSLAVVSAVLLCCPNVNAQEARALYNFDTGNVQVELVNDMITLFSVISRDSTGQDGTGFILAAGVNNSSDLGPASSANQDQVGFTSTTIVDDEVQPFPTGRFDIGNIFDAGITFTDNPLGQPNSIATDASGNPLGLAAFSFTVSGVGTTQIPLETISTAVPEPTTLPLLALASGMFLKRRRGR